MKIISPFKDYYDRVALQYGGGDPKVVYVRNRIVPDRIDNINKQQYDFFTQEGLSKEFIRNGNFPSIPSPTGYGPADERIETTYRLLVVAGRGFYICRRVDTSDWYAHGIHDWRLCTNDDLPKRRGENVSQWVGRHGQYRTKLVNLCKAIGHPVLLLESRDSYEAAYWNRVPNLGELGLQSVYQAEQLYQDLAMFIGNVMTENPDMMPTTPQTDIQKAEAHGFDKRQSFRHRK